MIDPKTSALVLADFQREIALAGGKMAPDDEDALARFEVTIANAARALAAARAAGMTVVHICHAAIEPGQLKFFNTDARLVKFILESGALRPGDPACEIVPALTPVDGETVLYKHGISPFAGTGLDEMLRAHGIDTVLVGGLVSHWVVEGAVRSGFDLGYRMIALEDACTSGVLESHTGAIARMGFLGDISNVAAMEEALAG